MKLVARKYESAGKITLVMDNYNSILSNTVMRYFPLRKQKTT